MSTDLRAPFPWFGGKSRVADVVWERFGDVRNYVEPFFGSGAVLLGRPSGARGTETVNDLDGFVANFWRAVALDPAAVWRWADSPVNEADLRARRVWMKNLGADFTDRLMTDPEWCDPKIAGWWAWGVSTSIGGQFLTRTNAMPHLGPSLGIHATKVAGLHRLADRLRRVRVLCGDWERMTGNWSTTWNGPAAMFLDPPYSADSDSDLSVYRTGSGTVAHDVRNWALANGDNPLLRIALCGYAGEGHDVLVSHGWTAHAWKAHGGYANQGPKGQQNAARETVWFSPHCLDAKAGRLFT